MNGLTTSGHFANQTVSRTTIAFGFIIVSSLMLRLMMCSSNLLVEEAYYWNYAQHLDWSYFDHPPMVALLIKIFTEVGGNNEFAIRMAAMSCWFVTVFFSVRLTRCVCLSASVEVVMLLSILPFFFVQSFIMTPDQPLLACWSAAVFYFYRALVLHETKSWLIAGLWVGLGLLSKYTIVLLGLATLLYMLSTPSAQSWFKRKEPYFCALIALSIFSPVIYWNAIHDWASFAFQGSRRFHSHFAFTLPQWLGLLMLFLTPPGVWGLWTLYRDKSLQPASRQFFQCYTWIPLLWFGAFSMMHAIKFNWIGPALLAIIPWLASSAHQHQRRLRKTWVWVGIVLMMSYFLLASSLLWGIPQPLNRLVLKKFIDWKQLTLDFHHLANRVQEQSPGEVLFVPLDLYNINSEFSFYQTLLLTQGRLTKTYRLVGRDEFGADSLMFRYWTKPISLRDKTLILVSLDQHDFDNPQLKQRMIKSSPREAIWSQSQGLGFRMKPYYYEIVRLK